MNIFSSDTNFTDDGNETNQYYEGSKSLPSENKTLKPIKEKQGNETTAKSTELLEDIKKNIAEKVEGIPFLKPTFLKTLLATAEIIQLTIIIQLHGTLLKRWSETGRSCIHALDFLLKYENWRYLLLLSTF